MNALADINLLWIDLGGYCKSCLHIVFKVGRTAPPLVFCIVSGCPSMHE